MPDIQTPEQVVAAIGELSGQMTDVQAQLRNVLAQGGGTMAAPMTGGVAAFSGRDGSLQLSRARVRAEIQSGGETYAIEGERPGLLDTESASLLSADEAASARAYRAALADVNACATVGVRTRPDAMLARLMQVADAAPPSIRGHLAAHSRDVAGTIARMHSVGAYALAGDRRRGAFASSSAAGSGLPGYAWVADEYLPDVVDSTNKAYGLAELMLTQAGGGPGLHQTAAVKLRVMKSGGGMAIMGRQTTDTTGGYPRTNVDTEVLSLTGGRAVHASTIDGLSLRDPREAVDWLALHRSAGMTARMATHDMVLLHGEKESAVGSHLYGSAGLAKIALDYRYQAFSGTDLDPLLLADGLIAYATDASATIDLASGVGVSASAVVGTQANLLSAHRLMTAAVSEQYRPGLAVVTSWGLAQKIVQLGIGVNGIPAVRPATPQEKAGNPWLVGVFYDGTPLMYHVAVTDFWATGSAVVSSSGTASALYYVNPGAILDVRGPDDGAVEVKPLVDGDGTLVVTKFQRAPFLAVDSGKKPVAVGFNLS